MKKLLFILFALVMGISTSHAQFGTLGKLYKTAKSAAAIEISLLDKGAFFFTIK